MKAGYDVTLIAQHDKNETVDRIKIIALPKTKNRIYRMFGSISKASWLALKQRSDIYHFHDPELLPVGVLLKIFTGKKIIYDVHEDYSKQALSKPYLPKIIRRCIAGLLRIIEYLSFKIFDGIITATEDILKNFSNHKRAISVKNFPITSNLSFVGENSVNNNEVFKLIYIGGLDKIRGITQIIRALEFIHSNYKVILTLCGRFESPDYKSEVKTLEGFKKVEYLGWIEYEKVPVLLSRFDAGIVCLNPISNYLTALPVKLFEYMAAGLPVIASDFPMWKEIVEGTKCGICVDPLNPKEIARAIEYLMKHSNLRKEMGINGKKAVLEKYNWTWESKELLSLYEELTNENRTIKA